MSACEGWSENTFYCDIKNKKTSQLITHRETCKRHASQTGPTTYEYFCVSRDCPLAGHRFPCFISKRANKIFCVCDDLRGPPKFILLPDVFKKIWEEEYK